MTLLAAQPCVRSCVTRRSRKCFDSPEAGGEAGGRATDAADPEHRDLQLPTQI